MLRRITSSRLARNSLYTISSQLAATLLQGLQFFAIARALGPHEFGRVASVVAFTSALLPFSGLGLANIAIMRLSRGQGEAALCFGNALFVASVTGLAAVALALVAGGSFLTDPGAWLLIALFGCSEILLTKYIEIATHVFYGIDRVESAALFYNLHLFVRLACAIALYFLVSAPTAQQWAVLHLLAGLVTTVVVMTIAVKRVGRPRVQPKMAWSDARQGVFFSVNLSARSIYTDFDKAVLARLVSLGTNGAYTAAYRLVAMAYMPVIAVLFAVQTRMFKTGADAGLGGTQAFAGRLCLMGTAYCGTLAVLIYAAAPIVPWLLGNGYALSSDVMRELCLLPLLLMLQAVYSEALIGADARKTVAGLQAMAALTSVVLNLVLVPRLSWHGSVYAAYATQIVLVLATIAVSARMRRREIKAAAAASS